MPRERLCLLNKAITEVKKEMNSNPMKSPIILIEQFVTSPILKVNKTIKPIMTEIQPETFDI